MDDMVLDVSKINDAHFAKIEDNKIADALNNLLMCEYVLGQASILAKLLLEDPHNVDLFKIQSDIRQSMSKNDLLKEYVYKVMEEI